MEKEAIQNFLNKKVKLVQNPKFVLFGEIIEVYDDCLVFETDQTTSLIDFSAIREIALLRGRHE